MDKQRSNISEHIEKFYTNTNHPKNLNPSEENNSILLDDNSLVELYNDYKEKLVKIWDLSPSTNQIYAYVKSMYDILEKKFGKLCKKEEIIANLVFDTSAIGLCESKIISLLQFHGED